MNDETGRRKRDRQFDGKTLKAGVGVRIADRAKHDHALQSAGSRQFLIGDRRQRRGYGQRAGRQIHRQRIVDDDHLGKDVFFQARTRNERRRSRRSPRVADQNIQRAQQVSAWRAGLYQDAGAICRREHDSFLLEGLGSRSNRSDRLQLAARIAVEAVDVEGVAIEAQVQKLENGGVDEMPVLHLAATHDKARAPHAIDQERRLAGGNRRVRRGNPTVGHLGKGFEHARGIAYRRLKHEYALARGGNFGDLIDRALDQQRAGHPAAHLHRGRAVQMRVIPVGARWVVRADRVFVLPGVSRLDAELRVIHHEIAVDARRHQAGVDVHSMSMQIRAVGIAQVFGGSVGWSCSAEADCRPRIRSVSPTFTRSVGAGMLPNMLRKLTALPSSVVLRYATVSVTSSLPFTDASTCGSTKVSVGMGVSESPPPKQP